MKRQAVIDWINQLLNVEQFIDYAPNGLQVEGTNEIKHILCSVTASLKAIEYAKKIGADTLLVHHGMFWKNEIPTITSWKKNRIKALLDSELNLLAYHLPLDAHESIGNNAQLASLMNWQVEKQSEEYGLLWSGSLVNPVSAMELAQSLAEKLNRMPLLIGVDKTIKKIAWCTGGAQSYFQKAIDLGVDAFVTGEVSEANYHLAHENEVLYLSAGHHATEKFGIQSLSQELKVKFDLDVEFFDENNPV